MRMYVIASVCLITSTACFRNSTTTQHLHTPRTTSATSVPSSPLKELQGAFRPTYDSARNAVDEQLSPLVVVRFSDMYLVVDGQVVAEGKGIPAKYHLLHRTAHVPLVIYLELRPFFGRPLTGEARTSLERYRSLVDAAIPDLTNHGFSDAEVEQQRILLEESSRYLGQLQDERVVSERGFGDYRSRVHNTMMILADIAGAAQVDALHATMTQWRKLLTEEQWSRLVVLVVGPRQPRHDYVATQYFAALFPRPRNTLFPGESDRVFYTETLVIDRLDKTFAAERRLVSTMLLDAAASRAIFNDSYRMSIDVMADGARRRLGEINFTDSDR